MGGREHRPEEIIGKLREAEIVSAQGGTGIRDALYRGLYQALWQTASGQSN